MKLSHLMVRHVLYDWPDEKLRPEHIHSGARLIIDDDTDSFQRMSRDG